MIEKTQITFRRSTFNGQSTYKIVKVVNPMESTIDQMVVTMREVDFKKYVRNHNSMPGRVQIRVVNA